MPQKGIATARIRDRGRVCVPIEVREQLNLSEDDLVRIQVEPVNGGSA
jgi:bifunctional DNA-binding transcriptional regulator/antitoxin component of YhaV-PrlF toxin-antitoxin module